MAQLKRVVEPFGEVNVYPAAGGQTRVVATILMEPYKEGAQTGIALDGSGSMKKMYGADDGGGVVSPIFKKPALQNEISPVAQQLCAYLARQIDADGGTTCIYWAVGMNGQEVEVVGDFTADQAERHTFGPPRDYGTGTYLMPAVRYFVDRFRDAPWGFYVFITDGELFDLAEVKQYTVQLARDVAAGRRHPVKFILIGLGSAINERQLEDLDDLDTGTDVDIWDHKMASELRMLQEIFAEVVDKNARIADNGRILDPQGRVVKNYSDTGMPALLEFFVPNGSQYFTLEVNGNRINQPLFEQAQVPSSQITATTPPPPVIPAPPPRTPPVLQPAASTPPVLRPADSTPPPLPAGSPPPPPAPAAAPPAPAAQTPPTDVKEDDLLDDAGDIAAKDEDDLWKQIDLRMADDEEKGKS